MAELESKDIVVESNDKQDAISFISRILLFSNGLSLWQQDALRRIFDHKITDIDINELATLAKSDCGIELSGAPKSLPLSISNIPATPQVDDVVQLLELKNVKNVNALAEHQTLSFLPKGITVIYGGNGTGKSGYSRILKSACRARKSSKIFGNVYNSTIGTPEADILVKRSGNDSELIHWSEDNSQELANLIVYDRDCERGYIDEKGQIQFEPPNLNIFKELVDVHKRVRQSLLDENDNIQIVNVDETVEDLANHPDSLE